MLILDFLILLFATYTVLVKSQENDPILQGQDHSSPGSDTKGNTSTKVVKNVEKFGVDQLLPASNDGDSYFPQYSANLIDLLPPGEFGLPVVIQNPTEEQEILIQRGYERNSFNEYVIHENQSVNPSMKLQ